MKDGTMERVQLSDSGPTVSRLLSGVWRLDEDPKGSSVGRVSQKIDHCLELGITTFDHADIYGDYRCEELFGAALRDRPGLREQIEIITKCDICLLSPQRSGHRVKHYDTSAGHIEASVERSLENLGTDRIDLLLLHRPDPLMNADETAAVLTRLQESGKVLHVGVSNFTPSQFDLLQSRLDCQLVTNQVELSVLCDGPLRDGTLDRSQQLRYRPLAWSPLAGGRLFDRADAAALRVRTALGHVAESVSAQIDQVAFAWILALPSGPLPILGTNREERLTSAVAALAIDLDRQSWFEIYQAVLGEEVP